MNKRSLYSPTYRLHDILVNLRTLRFIAKLTKSNFKSLRLIVARFRKNMKYWIRNEGLENLSRRIKNSEREYLLTGKTSWFSLKHFSYKGITQECTRILFTIHRNFKSKPILKVDTIVSPKPVDVNIILEKYQLQIEALFNRRCFRYDPLLDFVTRCRPSESKRKLVENLETPMSWMLHNHCDPVCDINPRTNGHIYPMRITLKSTANGQSLGTQKKDFIALHKHKELFEAIIGLYRVWGYTWKPDQYILNDDDLKNDYKVSRLYPLQDKSCKTRVVAILDNYSQNVLRPLHLLINSILKNNKCDFTFDHSYGVNYLRRFDKYLYSSDLSAATDLIPLDLSLYIIKEIIRRSDNLKHFSDLDKFIKDVKTVLVGRPFEYNGNNYYYSRGQPMGAYASFPLLSLTNHFLVHLAHLNVYPLKKGNSFFDYAVVGDDCTIADLSVGKEYHRLCEEFGIKVNYTKTIEGYKTFEFCRRVVVGGQFVSPPSWNAIYNCIRSKDPTSLINLLKSYEFKIPNYSILTEFFEPRVLRTMLATNPSLNIDGQPNIIRIPNDILALAERSLIIKEYLIEKTGTPLSKVDCFLILSGKKPSYFKDPYLDRLLYENNVFNILAWKSKEMCYFDLAKTRINLFYLSYLDTYLKGKRLKKNFYRQECKGKQKIKIRHVCMTLKKRWLTSESEC